MSKEIKDKYTAFEVSIEPKFIPGEGRVFDTWRTINMVVYARDINEAISSAKMLVTCNANDYEVTSACMSSHSCYNR